jgi:murein DD-endopeptidase MepM/ murein hydrolase activator NlpD
VSFDVASIVERARLAAGKPAAADAGGERARLERIAQEFESMLLVQVLRGMRTSGSWEDGEEGDTFGAESMYETLDVELASHLARIQGLGLSDQLLTAFDRMNPGTAADAAHAPATTAQGEMPGAAPAKHVEQPAATIAPEPPAPAIGPISGEVTSDFGWRRDPFTGQAKFHRGIDLRAAYGQDVNAAGGGRIVFSGEQGGYGTTVLIEHADGTRTRYAHLSVALVAAGDSVAAGQPIGRAGRSGRATGTHLHFEVIGADGRHVDPKGGAARS